MTTINIKAIGYAAIALAESDPTVVLHKYADPTEGERHGITVTEATEIAAEDPALVWASR